MMGASIRLYLLSLLFIVHQVSGAANGIVGFGISLYQDLCCQSCHDSLSSLYLNCTTFSMMFMDGMDMEMGDTSDDCYASNTPWLQTMAYCIQQNCNADGFGAEKQAKCFSTQAVAGASTPTFKESLPATAPTSELSADAEWLNETSLVNSELYYSTHGSLGEFARSEYIHTRYSVILYLIVIGTCIGSGILAQSRGMFPGLQKSLQASKLWAKLQAYIFLPASFGSRRLEPFPGNLGYIPGRSLSIFIASYIIINIILSSVSFRSFQPNTWFASSGFELCEYVGNRTGTLSLVNMSIAILFAGRNNILIAITGWSQTTFLTFHRWAARVATLQAVIHSIVYTLAYYEPGYDGASVYAAQTAMPFYYWGIIATIAMCLAIAFAVLPFRTRFYDFFVVTHIALVILSLVGCWYHLVPHFGYVYGYQVWLYICFAFWAADRVARVARIAYYNRLGNSKAIVEAVPGCDIMQVTVYPRVAWSFGPAQHSFLYLPGLGKPWESHPFSIASWRRKGEALHVASAAASISDSTGKLSEEGKEPGIVSISPVKTPTTQQTHIQDRTSIQFLIRTHKGMTSSLQNRLLSSPSRSSMEISIYTEGPYSGHRATLQPLLLADTVLCLVGGIGITNALGYIQEYAGAHVKHSTGSGCSSGVMKKATRFILAWSARELVLINHVKQNFLLESESVEGMEYSFFHTGSSETAEKLEPDIREGQDLPLRLAGATAGRMDIGAIIRSSLEVGHQTTILVCGPGSMTDEATKQIVGCVKEGFRVDLVEEAFAW